MGAVKFEVDGGLFAVSLTEGSVPGRPALAVWRLNDAAIKMSNLLATRCGCRSPLACKHAIEEVRRYDEAISKIYNAALAAMGVDGAVDENGRVVRGRFSIRMPNDPWVEG